MGDDHPQGDDAPVGQVLLEIARPGDGVEPEGGVCLKVDEAEIERPLRRDPARGEIAGESFTEPVFQREPAEFMVQLMDTLVEKGLIAVDLELRIVGTDKGLAVVGLRPPDGAVAAPELFSVPVYPYLELPPGPAVGNDAGEMRPVRGQEDFQGLTDLFRLFRRSGGQDSVVGRFHLRPGEPGSQEDIEEQGKEDEREAAEHEALLPRSQLPHRVPGPRRGRFLPFRHTVFPDPERPECQPHHGQAGVGGEKECQYLGVARMFKEVRVDEPEASQGSIPGDEGGQCLVDPWPEGEAEGGGSQEEESFAKNGPRGFELHRPHQGRPPAMAIMRRVTVSLELRAPAQNPLLPVVPVPPNRSCPDSCGRVPRLSPAGCPLQRRCS